MKVMGHFSLYCESCADYFTLRRFLRARSYDLDKAVKMWLDHVAWREANGVDDILQSFYFSEREKFLAAYPQGYHKTDKMVNVHAASALPACLKHACLKGCVR